MIRVFRRAAWTVCLGWMLATGMFHALPPAPAAATPPYALPNTEVLSLPRDTTEGRMAIYVSLPRAYHQAPEARYPVVLLLDPDYAFAIAHNVVEHFVDRRNLDPMIVIGVGYPGQSQDLPAYRQRRTRDYTPVYHPSDGYGPEFQQFSGGGPRFRDYLIDELLPYIDQRYRTNGDRTLVGHSYGGLFATFVLLTRPEPFDRFLAVSPSYWYDDEMIFDLAAASAEVRPDLTARVALIIGERENRRYDMVDDLRRMAAQLRRDFPQLDLHAHVYSDETHNSVFPAAFTGGIRWLFREE